RPNKSAINPNCTNKNKCAAFANDTPKSKLAIENSEIRLDYSKKDFIMAEKRNVIIFKVLEQIIDPSTKNVLKETIINNEEVITSTGSIQFDLLINDTTTTSTDMTRSPVGSPGFLGDISGFSNSKSVNNISTTNSIEF